MTISMFCAYMFMYQKETGCSLDEAAAYVRSLGIEQVDINPTELGGYTREELKAALDRAGLSVACIYGPAELASLNNQDYIIAIGEALDMVDMAVQFGAKRVMIVPGTEVSIAGHEDKARATERILEGMHTLAYHADKLGIELTLENYSSDITPFATIEEIKYMLDNVKDLTFTYDTGNFRYRGVDTMEAYEALRPFTTHVHLKDWGVCECNCCECMIAVDGTKLCGVEIGTGIIPCGEILDRLSADGYDGALCIEFNAENEPISKLLANSAKFVKERIGK